MDRIYMGEINMAGIYMAGIYVYIWMGYIGYKVAHTLQATRTQWRESYQYGEDIFGPTCLDFTFNISPGVFCISN